MARPKKQTPPPKTRQLTLRLTEDLFDLLTENAQKARLPRTEYIRSLILNHHPVIKYETVFDSAELLSIFSNLGKIGSNLNQIARHLNQDNPFEDSMKKEIQICITELYKMRDELKEQAGEYRGNH